MPDKEDKRKHVLAEISDTYSAYWVFPHHGLAPDWFIRYWDLAEAVCEYFDVPFDKPTPTTEKDLQEYMNPTS